MTNESYSHTALYITHGSISLNDAFCEVAQGKSVEVELNIGDLIRGGSNLGTGNGVSITSKSGIEFEQKVVGHLIYQVVTSVKHGFSIKASVSYGGSN